MTAIRVETDSFGPLDVPADKYWGAQTQRSIINFPIGWERQPVAIIRALGVIKKACALVNVAQGDLDAELGKLAAAAARPGAGTARVTRTIVQEFTGLSREEQAWEIQGPVLEGKADAALIKLDELLREVTTGSEALMEMLETLPKLGKVTFRQITEAIYDRIEVVVRFLAILELYKQGRVSLEQSDRFGEIEVQWTAGDDTGFVAALQIDDYDG